MKRIGLVIARIAILFALASFLFFPPRALFLLVLAIGIILIGVRLLKRPLATSTTLTLFALVLCEHVVKYLYSPPDLARVLFAAGIGLALLYLALGRPERRSLLVIGAASIIGFECLGVWAYNLTDSFSPKNSNPSGPVVFLGDSLTSGIEDTSDDTFASFLQKRFTTQIINAGQAGDLTQDALNRLDHDVLSHKPRTVVVMIGGNDILTPVPRQTLAANIDQILGRVTRAGADVVLVEVPGGLITDRYLGIYSEAARRYHAYRVDEGMLRWIFCLSSRYTSDGLHLNRQGNARMAERFYAILHDACGIR